MKITKSTLYKDCHFFVKEQHYEEVKKLVNTEDLQDYNSLFSLKLGEFIKLTKGDEELIKELFFKDDKFTFWELCKRIKWLEIETQKVKNIFDSMSIKQKPIEIKAAENIKFTPFEYSIRIFAVKIFHLHSFEEADECNFGQVMTVKKDEFNKMLYEKNLRELYERENK